MTFEEAFIDELEKLSAQGITQRHPNLTKALALIAAATAGNVAPSVISNIASAPGKAYESSVQKGVQEELARREAIAQRTKGPVLTGIEEAIKKHEAGTRMKAREASSQALSAGAAERSELLKGILEKFGPKAPKQEEVRAPGAGPAREAAPAGKVVKPVGPPPAAGARRAGWFGKGVR